MSQACRFLAARRRLDQRRHGPIISREILSRHSLNVDRRYGGNTFPRSQDIPPVFCHRLKICQLRREPAVRPQRSHQLGIEIVQDFFQFGRLYRLGLESFQLFRDRLFDFVCSMRRERDGAHHEEIRGLRARKARLRVYRGSQAFFPDQSLIQTGCLAFG